MAARSDYTTRRWFAQDDELQVTTTAVHQPTTLRFECTIRVQVVASDAAGDITLNIGGIEQPVNTATDAEPGGRGWKTIYADFRGASCSTNNVSFTATDDSQVSSVFYCLVPASHR